MMNESFWKEWCSDKNPFVAEIYREVDEMSDQEGINRLLAEKIGELKTEVQILKKLEASVIDLASYSHESTHSIRDALQNMTIKLERVMMTGQAQDKTLELQNKVLEGIQKSLAGENDSGGVFERIRKLEARERFKDKVIGALSLSVLALLTNVVLGYFSSHK